jgi:hypothetical protein
MTTTPLFTNQTDALELEDELLDLTADLLALKDNQSFVSALFEVPSGQWLNVGEMLSGRPAVQEQLRELETMSQGQLQVVWLPHPETSAAYSLVLFFMESIGWDNLAVYHRELVLN